MHINPNNPFIKARKRSHIYWHKWSDVYFSLKWAQARINWTHKNWESVRLFPFFLTVAYLPECSVRTTKPFFSLLSPALECVRVNWGRVTLIDVDKSNGIKWNHVVICKDCLGSRWRKVNSISPFSVLSLGTHQVLWQL